MNRNQALDSAKAAINRAPKSYGVPREHFERVARHWNAHLAGISLRRKMGQLDLGPTDVAIMLGLVKIARLEHDPQHADSWCDLAGYAACGAEVSEPEFAMPAYASAGAIIEMKPGETPAQAIWRATCDRFAATQEPAWKRAKVGDRIRIREGAKNAYGDRLLPNIAEVVRINTDPSRRLVVNTEGPSHSGNFVRNSDVLEILPPLPESKFGFTVGETVSWLNMYGAPTDGTVAGFSGAQVLVQAPFVGGTVLFSPSTLRHGA